MKQLLDLRFIIGVFFIVIGILLAGYSFLHQQAPASVTINRWCGIVFLAFGLLMMIFSLKKNPDGR